MYIADVGQDAREEVNFEPAGHGRAQLRLALHGGLQLHRPHRLHLQRPRADAAGPRLRPRRRQLLGHRRLRLRGCAIPDLVGTYFFADYCSGRIWSFELVGGVVTNFINRTAELDPPGVATINQITSFGADALGEIYIIDQGGQIYKILPDTIDDCNRT